MAKEQVVLEAVLVEVPVEFLVVAAVTEASMAKMLVVLKRAVIRVLMGLLDAHLPELMVKTRAVYRGKIQPSLRRLMVNLACQTEMKSIALMRIGWAQQAQSLHREV